MKASCKCCVDVVGVSWQGICWELAAYCGRFKGDVISSWGCQATQSAHRSVAWLTTKNTLKLASICCVFKEEDYFPFRPSGTLRMVPDLLTSFVKLFNTYLRLKIDTCSRMVEIKKDNEERYKREITHQTTGTSTVSTRTSKWSPLRLSLPVDKPSKTIVPGYCDC